MGFLENLITQVKGALNDALDKASEPGRTARQVVRDLEEQIDKANTGMVNVMAEYEVLKQKKAQLEEEAADWHEKAKKALAAGREDLAKKALEQEQEAQSQAQVYQKQIEALEPTINELKAKIQELKNKKQELESKADLLGTRYEVAKAQEKASEITTGIGDSHAKEKLDSVEDKVLKEEARAKAMKNIEESQTGEDIEKEFEALDKKSSVDDKLEALKKEMNLKQ